MEKAIIDEPMNNIHNNIFGPRGPHAKNAAPHRYVAEMNGALERSQIPIEYKQWGSVQMIPQTHAEMVSGVSLFRCWLLPFAKYHQKAQTTRIQMRSSSMLWATVRRRGRN